MKEYTQLSKYCVVFIMGFLIGATFVFGMGAT